MRFNPPPNWPKFPKGFKPGPGWRPDPTWGEAPIGWPLWIEDGNRPARGNSQTGRIGFGGLVAILIIGALVFAAVDKHKTTPTGAPQPLNVPASSSAPVGVVSTTPDNDNIAHPPMDDVTLGTCTIDGTTGWPSCAVTIVNNSSKTSSYVVTLSELSADGATKYGEMTATVDDLAPGQSSPQTAQGFNTVPTASKVKITDVQRYASN